jgi:hypothetical protein
MSIPAKAAKANASRNGSTRVWLRPGRSIKGRKV